VAHAFAFRGEEQAEHAQPGGEGEHGDVLQVVGSDVDLCECGRPQMRRHRRSARRGIEDERIVRDVQRRERRQERLHRVKVLSVGFETASGSGRLFDLDRRRRGWQLAQHLSKRDSSVRGEFPLRSEGLEGARRQRTNQIDERAQVLPSPLQLQKTQLRKQITKVESLATLRKTTS